MRRAEVVVRFFQLLLLSVVRVCVPARSSVISTVVQV